MDKILAFVKTKYEPQDVVYPCDGEAGCSHTLRVCRSDNAKEIKRKALIQGWYYYSVGPKRTKFVCPDCFRNGE